MLNATPSSQGKPGDFGGPQGTWPAHPVAGTLDDAVAVALAKGAPAAIWTLSDAAPVWWNPAGGALFDLPGSGKGAGDLAAALSRSASPSRPWLEKRRVSRGAILSLATLLLCRVLLRDGRDALVAVATAVAPPLAVKGAVPPSPDRTAPLAAEERPEPSTIPAEDDGEAPASRRRFTWQTDAMGRLLAGPGASLSQALGQGAPMQAALLADLLLPDEGAVAGALAGGRPFARLPVETLPGPEGLSFQGLLFGAPVLDRDRRPAGYRGFLAVLSVRRAVSEAEPATAPLHEAELQQNAQPEAETSIDESGPNAEAMSAFPSVEASPAATDSEQAPEPPVSDDDQERPSNVVSLWPSGIETRANDQTRRGPAAKDQAVPVLSPSERDAFADIAKALGASWAATPGRAGPQSPVGPGSGEAPRQDADSPPGTDALPASQPADAFSEASSADLAAIINRLPVGVVVHRAGKALAANRTLLALLGHGGLDDFEARGGVDKLFIEGGDLSDKRAVAIRAADGEVITVEARCQAIRLGGEAATLLSLRRSLASETDRRDDARWQAIAAKDREIEDLRAILAIAIDGVVTLDGLGRIMAMNAPAEALFGYDAKEIAGEAFAVLIAHEGHAVASAALRDALADADRSNGTADIVGRARDGRPMSLSMKLVRSVSEASPARLHAVFRDLTAVKESEAGLVEARTSAERLSAQKSEFLAKVSHEIRTPLNSIVGFADMIAEERFGPLSNQRYKEYITDIRSSGAHIISLVNDLLDLSKIEAGRMELSFTSVNLNAEVAAAAASVQTGAARARVLMRQSLAKGLPGVIADERSVKQIVLNLLSNAVKFTDPGGQVILSTTRSDIGEVILRVRDTGIGMSERQLDEAMQPFRQFATATRPGGSGLGLSLTKALVKANHAKLSVNSTLGEGTFVEVIFPQGRLAAV